MTKFTPILPPFRRHKKKVCSEIIKTCGFIYQLGESSILREISKEIPVEKIISDEVQKKIKYVKNCLIKFRQITKKGRGISAVQVGILERLIILYVPDQPRGDKRQRVEVGSKNKFLVVINPKITKESEKLYKHPEMCMSLVPIIANVIRPAWIEFEYFDENGKKQFWQRKDDTKKGKSYNRVLQHEIDHLNGVMMIDKIESKDIIFESDPNWHKNAKYEET